MDAEKRPPARGDAQAAAEAGVEQDEAAGPGAERGAARKGHRRVTKSDQLRTKRIFELRDKIASGEYEVDPEIVAKRVLGEL